MKTLIKITLLTLGLGTAAFPAFSAVTTAAGTDATTSTPEAKPAPHARAKALAKHRAEIRKHVAQRLGLSADQVSQLKAKRASTAASIKAIRADSTLTKQQKRAKARETLQSARNDMRSVLTPDQQAKLKALREKHQKVK